MALFLLMMAICLGLCNTAQADLPASTSGVTYEIFVGSFCDSNGDGQGDLQGIIQQLDYLESLHVRRIWLTPIHPSPSYHRYDVSDYMTVDPVLGSMDDFRQLVKEAKLRGMEILLDLVVNHTALDHSWFQAACQALASGEENPYVSWYNFSKGQGQHPVPHAEGWFYEGQFTSKMPDLNLDHPDVRAEIDRIMTFWQEQGVGGFRLDAVTSYYTDQPAKNAEFLKFVSDVAHGNASDAYVVGEAWTSDQAILRLYESGVDSLFNFPASDIDGTLIRAALNGAGRRAAEKLEEWNKKLQQLSSNCKDSAFLTNHDMNRAAGMLRGDLSKEKVAASLLLLSPGNPVVYYGEELGMYGSGRDENKRLPMLWSTNTSQGMCLSPKQADQKQRLKQGVDVQSTDNGSLLNHYRALLALRAECPEFETKDMTLVNQDNEALACYLLSRDGCTIGVIINTDSEQTFDISDPFLGAKELVGEVGDAQLTDSVIRLPGGSSIVFRMGRCGDITQ